MDRNAKKKREKKTDIKVQKQTGMDRNGQKWTKRT